MDTFLQDIRHGLRVLIKNPGFTAVALGTLTLGIGATTAVFGVVNATLLRPLPYPDADRLVRIQEEHPMNRGREMPAFMTSDTLEAWRENPQAIDQIAGYTGRSFTYQDESEPVRVRGAAVSPALFPLLRATAWLGRVFTEDEEASAAQPVAVLSYARWQTRHDADPRVLGRLITLDDVSYSVIGVMPEGFYFPDRETESLDTADPDDAATTPRPAVHHRLLRPRAGSRTASRWRRLRPKARPLLAGRRRWRPAWPRRHCVWWVSMTRWSVTCGRRSSP